jgi:hypothetical protein
MMSYSYWPFGLWIVTVWDLICKKSVMMTNEKKNTQIQEMQQWGILGV